VVKLADGVGYVVNQPTDLDGPANLAVVGKVAYRATKKGVRAWDVEDINAPKLLDFHADADFGAGLAALIADDPHRLAVVDAGGRLYVIPLGQQRPGRAPEDVPRRACKGQLELVRISVGSPPFSSESGYARPP
jgi:hypothetical protein